LSKYGYKIPAYNEENDDKQANHFELMSLLNTYVKEYIIEYNIILLLIYNYIIEL